MYGKLELRSIIEKIAFSVLLVSGLGMMIGMFMGTADVVGTQLLGRPLPGALELTESNMVLIVFGGLAFAQMRRAHIRVELLYTRLPVRGKLMLDSLAGLAAIIFFGLLMWQGFNEAVFSWSIRESSVGLIRFPLYPARWLLVLGTLLMVVQLMFDMWRDIRSAITLRDVDHLNADFQPVELQLAQVADDDAVSPQSEQNGGR